MGARVESHRVSSLLRASACVRVCVCVFALWCWMEAHAAQEQGREEECTGLPSSQQTELLTCYSNVDFVQHRAPCLQYVQDGLPSVSGQTLRVRPVSMHEKMTFRGS